MNKQMQKSWIEARAIRARMLRLTGHAVEADRIMRANVPSFRFRYNGNTAK